MARTKKSDTTELAQRAKEIEKYKQKQQEQYSSSDIEDTESDSETETELDRLCGQKRKNEENEKNSEKIAKTNLDILAYVCENSSDDESVLAEIVEDENIETNSNSVQPVEDENIISKPVYAQLDENVTSIIKNFNDRIKMLVVVVDNLNKQINYSNQQIADSNLIIKTMDNQIRYLSTNYDHNNRNISNSYAIIEGLEKKVEYLTQQNFLANQQIVELKRQVMCSSMFSNPYANNYPNYYPNNNF